MILLKMLLSFVPFITSYFIVSLLLNRKSFIDNCISLSLTWGVGCGLSSITYTTLSLLQVFRVETMLVFEVALLGIVSLIYFKKKAPTADLPLQKIPIQLPLLIVSIFIIMITFLSFYHSHGGWDAWSIWNARSRAMYRMSDEWLRAFTFGQHLDYPILLPASITRMWTVWAIETPLTYILHAILFLLSLCTLLWSGIVKISRNHSIAFFSIIILMAIPFTGRLTLMQYSDLPLAYLLLGSLIVINGVQNGYYNPNRGYLLAGILIGVSAWTKNEGLSFFVVITLALTVSLLIKRQLFQNYKRVILFVFGALPIILFVLWFKSSIGAANDLIEGQEEAGTILNLINPQRYGIILLQTVKKISDIGIWGLIPYTLPILLWFHRKKFSIEKKLVVNYLTIVLIVCIYFLVYSVTPHDLKWHVNHSVDRLLYHVTPLVIYTGALMYNDLPQKKETLTFDETA